MNSDGKKKKQLSLKRKQQTLLSTGIRQKDQPSTSDPTEPKGPCAQKCESQYENHHGGGGAVGRGGSYTSQCGLENMGNTCFISAVVQALRCAPGLHQGMTVGHFELGKVPKWSTANKVTNRQSSSSTDHTLHAEFAKLLCDMREVEEGEVGRLSLRPDQFVNTTQTVFPQFVKKKQHDAQEFLRCLLGTLQLHVEQTTPSDHEFQQGLDSDSYLPSTQYSLSGDHDNMVTKAKKRPMISPPTPTLSSKAKRDCLQGTTPITSFFKTITPKKEDENRMCENVSSDDEDIASLPSSRVSWVSELFEGTLTSQTCCLECEEKSSREETFLDISVPVTVTAEQVDVLEELKCAPVSLSWSISQYASSEMLCGRDKYWCDCCHHFTEGRRTLYFSKLPKIMTIHLNRFSHKWYQSRFSIGKTVGNIAIPLHLSFSQWCLPSSNSSTQRVYELYAIVLHTGSSCTSGHYTAVVKATYSSLPPSQGSSNWLLFNDDRTTLLSQKSFLSMISPLSTSSSSSPYILFYTYVKKTDFK